MTTPTFVDVVNIAAYTPAETTELVSRMGVKKGNMRPEKVFMSAVYGGMLLSFGCATSLIASAAPWFQDNAPGMVRVLGALVFPLGLVLVVLTGSDLFTASNMLPYTAAYQSGRCSSTGSYVFGVISPVLFLPWLLYSGA
ncbi:hypothetical protein OQA88_5179 [Cercophora sp. LCS_1]